MVDALQIATLAGKWMDWETACAGRYVVPVPLSAWYQPGLLEASVDGTAYLK